MVQVKYSPSPAPPARRSPLVWVGAAAIVALLVVGVPLFMFGGGEDPGPTTIPPATVTTVPDDRTPTTVVPTTPPPTTAPDSGEPPSYLNAGFDAMRGTGYYPGRIVAESPLTVGVGTDADARVTVNGTPLALDEFGGGTIAIDLVDGDNTIVVVAARGGGTVEETLEVRYLPDATVEFTFLTQVGTDEIVADYAQWLTGDEANQAAFEDGAIGSLEEGVPNDYYIRNVNPQLRTVSVANDVRVMLVSPIDVTPIEVPLDDWVALFKPDGTPWDYEAGDEVPTWDGPYFDYYGANAVYTPYWLYLDAEGTVFQIEQQYIP